MFKKTKKLLLELNYVIHRKMILLQGLDLD